MGSPRDKARHRKQPQPSETESKLFHVGGKRRAAQHWHFDTACSRRYPWSSSAALVSIVGALNRAYDIDEGRPWWKVRLVAIGLTLGVAMIVLVALSLVLVGPG